MNDSKRPRRVQQRALETRAALLDTAIEMFSRSGYDGISVRGIEEQAGVNRGLVAYHFGDKATLWRLAADRLFDAMQETLAEALAEDDDGDDNRSRALARAFVRYSAARPALNRLMMQESLQSSWRLDYLVDTKIRPMLEAQRSALPEVSRRVWGDNDAHRYYLFIGAAAFVFSAAEECRKLFGRSPREDAFVEQHADLVLATLFPPH